MIYVFFFSILRAIYDNFMTRKKILDGKQQHKILN